MHRVLLVSPALRLASALLFVCGITSGVACGDKKGDPPAPPGPSAAPPASASSAARGPASPLSVVLESKGPLVFSGLLGGIVLTDVAHTHLGRTEHGDIVAEPMPAGLPAGAGRPLRAGGRMPGSVWLLYETLTAEGKVEANPLFRLGKEGWKKFADDWKPVLAPWTKHRLLAMSTSSGRLKIKVMEPLLPSPPADMPSPHLGDASCEKTLKVDALATLGSGEVFAAGSCTPDTAAGAGASPVRYVIVRWPLFASPRAAAVADAGMSGAAVDDGGLGDAGPSDAGAPGDDRPGVVDVIPGVSSHLVHEALYARSATDVWAAARDPSGKPVGGTEAAHATTAGASRLFRFDGATWGAVALPPSTAVVRGLTGTADGALWLATERAVFLRSPAGEWQEVLLPVPPGEAGVTWEMLDLSAPDGADVWIAARRTSSSGTRDVVLRTRAAPGIIRWE